MIDNITGETWRFDVDSNGTIIRGRAYQLPSEWISDAWSCYWDGDWAVGFYEEYARGRRPLNDSDECERAISAYQSAHNYGGDPHAALDRLAERLTGNPEAQFICVGLDRGMDFYVLSWSGDPDNVWRDEIEAVNDGDIWRIEVEEYQPGMGPDGSGWVPCDEYPEEFYGEARAMTEFEKVFPLAEFPAERVLNEAGA